MKVIEIFKKRYNCIVGFSGHEPGINVAVAAVALGAKVVEKHVTLNKKMNGTDHLASIDMKELKEMIDAIRQIESAIGSETKRKYKSEDVLISILGKSLVTKKSLKAGSIIKKEDLSINIIKDKEKEKKVKFEVFNQLKILGRKYSFFNINLFYKFSYFGRSFHLGSSVPMLDEKENKMNIQNDLYTKKNGEVSKFKNVFVIDNTNFTNIPAGDISLTIMANALRIATESLDD